MSLGEPIECQGKITEFTDKNALNATTLEKETVWIWLRFPSAPPAFLWVLSLFLQCVQVYVQRRCSKGPIYCKKLWEWNCPFCTGKPMDTHYILLLCRGCSLSEAAGMCMCVLCCFWQWWPHAGSTFCFLWLHPLLHCCIEFNEYWTCPSLHSLVHCASCLSVINRIQVLAYISETLCGAFICKMLYGLCYTFLKNNNAQLVTIGAILTYS